MSWHLDAQAVVSEQVLTGTLARYRLVSGDAAATRVVLLKLLVSNPAAGAVIGRSGANREYLQTISFARIQLSRPEELYPGTNDRVLLLTGTLNSVLAALYSICGFPGMAVPVPEAGLGLGLLFQWRLLLPASVCGYVLGTSGTAIQLITAQSEAYVSISAVDPLIQEQDPEVPRERVATISGGCFQTLRAVALIMDRLLSRPDAEPGEPPFEGHFPSTRMAVHARTGPLRNPRGLIQQHLLQAQQQQQLMQQQQQQLLAQQQQQQQHQHLLLQQQQQQAAALAAPSGQALYAPQAVAGGFAQQAAAGSTYVYVPLQHLQQAAPAAPHFHLPLPLARPPSVAGALQALPSLAGPNLAALASPVSYLGGSQSPATLPFGASHLSGGSQPAAGLLYGAAGGPQPAAGMLYGAAPMAGSSQAAAAAALPFAALPGVGGPQPAAGVQHGGAAATPAVAGGLAATAAAAAPAAAAQADVLGPRHEVRLEVPENRIGMLMGRRGEGLREMQRVMHVVIHVEPKRLPPPGQAPDPEPPMRRVTITGGRNFVMLAEQVIRNRISGLPLQGAGGVGDSGVL